jgi:hypothetical protein
VAAAERLDAALRAGSLSVPDGWEGLGDLLTRNVLRNAPAHVRAERLAALLSELGPISEAAPLRDRVTAAPSPGTLRWVLRCANGTLVAQVRLIGQRVGAVVQAISFAAAGPDGIRAKDDVEGVEEHVELIWD